MICRIIIFAIFGLSSAGSVQGQCPDRAMLWKRLNYLKDSAGNVPTGAKLSELLQDESALQHCHYTNDSVFAFLLEQISSNYYKNGEFAKAIEYEKRSINVIKENLGKPTVNSYRLARSYYKLYSIYDTLNFMAQKFSALDACISLARERHSFDTYALYLLYQRVQYSYRVGDFHLTIDDAEMGERLSRKYLHGSDSTIYCNTFNFWKATALISLKQFAEAEKLIARWMEMANQDGSRTGLGTAYDMQGILQVEKGEYEDAFLSFEKAFKFSLADGYYPGCQQALTNLGYFLFEKKKDIKGSLAASFKAVEYLQKNEPHTRADSFECLNIYTNIANVYAYTNDFDSASKYYRLAFDQFGYGENVNEVMKHPFYEFFTNYKFEFLPNHIRDKAEAYLKYYRATGNKAVLSESIKMFRTVNELLNRIRIEETETQSKLFSRSNMRPFHEHAIEACYLSGDMDDALYFFENSRAVLLGEQLNQQIKLEKSELLNLALIKKEILELKRVQNEAKPSSAQLEDIQSRLFDARQRLVEFEDVLKLKNPLYYQSVEDTSIISIGDVQRKLLSDHQGLLEMFVGDSAVYTLMITPRGTRLRKLDKKNFETTSNQFVSYISNASLLNDHYDDFTRVGNQLYYLIFQGDPAPPGRIIISPDGHYFPFEALVEGNPGHSPVYFVQDHAVSYTYSARYLMNGFSTSTSDGGESFLGVAPVNYSSSFSLAPLPQSDRSLREIGSYLGNTLNLVAEKASKTNFLQLFSNYKIIQLYTHSSENSSRGEPVIYFADSALYLSELIPEKIPLTRLVVLSACETGNGKSYQGEGVFSFNRGFASMGIPSSVINLWDVDNITTYRLVELFYKYISQELPIDVAMQKAKVEFIQTSSKEQGLPYYWAASIIAGKSDKVYSKKRNSWVMYAVAGAGLAGLCLLFWAGWKQRRSRILSTAG